VSNARTKSSVRTEAMASADGDAMAAAVDGTAGHAVSYDHRPSVAAHSTPKGSSVRDAVSRHKGTAVSMGHSEGGSCVSYESSMGVGASVCDGAGGQKGQAEAQLKRILKEKSDSLFLCFYRRKLKMLYMHIQTDIYA